MKNPLRKMLQDSEYALAQYTHLKKCGIEVDGVIIASKDIINTKDADVGFDVIFQYTTCTGQVLTGENQTTLHFPQRELWEVFAKSRQIGAKVRVIYDSEEIYLPLVRFTDDTNSLDDMIVTQQKVWEQTAQENKKIQEQWHCE